MLLTGKRLLALIGISGALYYASQHYTLSGLSQLRIEPVARNGSAGNDSVPGEYESTGWTALESTIQQSTTLQPNRSVGLSPLEQIQPSSSPTSSLINSLTKEVSTKSPVNRTFENDVPKVRIASFNLHSFNETKLRKQPVVETLARIIRQFDVIALQHIDSRQTGLLPTLVDRINMSDRRYDYCIGPRVGSDGQSQQFAFLFDTARIETDRDQLYTLEDPQNLLEYDPLVGWFRTKHTRPELAFTFSLVNIRLNPANAEKERSLLPAVIKSVKQDGRKEDDIILLGDFSSSSRQLSSVAGLNMLLALEEVATTVSGEYMLDNILLPLRSTDEYTGRSGVIDFLRQLNLSYDQAMQVSSHLPVWAEFYAHEGAEIR